MAARAHQAGWQALSAASRTAPLGGVGILVRQGLLARQVKPQANEGPGSDVAVYLRLMWCHAYYRKPSISRKFAVAVPSGRVRRVIGGAKDSSFGH